MRLSRCCYDKSHRCPGWAGGGFKFAKVYHCDDGSIRTRDLKVGYEDGRRVVFGDYPGQTPWRFGRCSQCDVVTWPLITRFIDPTYWRYMWARTR